MFIVSNFSFVTLFFGNIFDFISNMLHILVGCLLNSLQGMLNRKELRKALDRGANIRIAKRCKRRPEAVSDWFRGRRNSPSIQAAALAELAEQVVRKQQQAAHELAQFEAAKRGEKL